ncbi:25830_t:CDS:2 [Dentiscutata erythropus]|uniref:25830_t:CDS:1 n=1 Tax=Dentiscutata erythropus TaxID=1348616 RepID=A0A9N8W4Y8_9GLOM|nr:25830_t:CDS:2 [Dentiscutata erythropus]
MPNFCHEESSNDDSEESDIDTLEALTNYRQIHSSGVTSTDSTNNLQNAKVINTMKNIIYNSLFDYWNEFVMTGLLASLLDLHLKTLSSWDDITQEKAKAKLTCQFELLIASNNEQTMASTNITSKNSNILRRRLHFSIFGTSNNITSSPLDELECYLDSVF